MVSSPVQVMTKLRSSEEHKTVLWQCCCFKNSFSALDRYYVNEVNLDFLTYRRTVFKVNPVATTIMCALSPFQKFYKVSLVKMIMSVFIAYTARCTIILKISQLTFWITDWYYLQSRETRSMWSIDNSYWASRLKWLKGKFFLQLLGAKL
jgi:hypothetical protein